MRKYPPELLQKIRDGVNLVELVGEHVVLRKTGANHVGLCPFHSERSPSFSVSESKQLYHCYGCKKGGDLFSFVMEIHGIGFPEAIEELAERSRTPLPRDFGGGAPDGGLSPEERKRREELREKTATAYKLNRFVAAFYHQNSPGLAAPYFKARGIGAEWQRSFYLGAAPASWDALSRHLIAKKAPLPLAVELGLIKPSPPGRAGPGYFDLFRNRAIFPIVNLRGKVAGFGGRTLPGEGEAGGDGPKYLNSVESPIFSKGKLAYGLYQAQKHIREKNEVILVEGYFDVLALHAAGFQNAVASCGTALTADHLALFRRFAGKITLLFDGDKAGVSATDRAMLLGLQHGCVLGAAVMPEGLDPDEILFDQETGAPVPGGIEKMQEILGRAEPLLDTRMEEAVRQAQESPENRAQAIKRVSGWLAQFSDPVGREVRVDWLRKRLDVPRALLDQAMGLPSRRGGGSVVSPKAGSSTRLSATDRILLQGLARGGECSSAFPEASAKLPPKMALADLFDSVSARELVRELEASAPAGGGLLLSPDRLNLLHCQTEPDSQVQSTLTQAWLGGETPFSIRDFQLALDRAIGRLWARFSQRIKMALAEAEAKKDAGLHSKLMKEYLDVQRKMKEFNSFYDEA